MPPNGADAEFSQRRPERGATLLLLTMRYPQSKYWDIYDIKMRGGDGNVDVPDWVLSWNTDDDSRDSSGNRTFQLMPLIDTMNRAITQHVVFCEYVVSIGRGA